MLSMPHLIVLFVVALVIFGPQKLPELARMLGKATAEFRKMTGDFRYALEEEVRELERNTRIREAEAAAASSPAQAPPAQPEGTTPRDVPPPDAVATTIHSGGFQVEPAPAIELPPPAPSDPAAVAPGAATPAHEKPSDDNAAV
jgi:sec-independent protein translocase protein TatB